MNEYEALTPVQIEQKLRWCVTELTRAENRLRWARDVETNHEAEYRRARRAAMLSPECPKVKRDGWTTAERDAWVEQQCEDEWLTYRIATATREAAQEHIRTTRDIAGTVQSLGALVRSAYSMAGQS